MVSRDILRDRELDRLEDVMERVGEDEDRIDKILRVAAVDSETYEDFLGLYEEKAAQVVRKDVFYPYKTMDGTFVIGEDPDGHRIGLT